MALVLPVGLTALPGAAQSGGEGASGTNLVVTDPVGDAGLIGLPLPANPAGDPYAHVDITYLEFGNDRVDSYDVIIGVAGFGNPAQTAAQALALTDFECWLEWSYDHDMPEVDYGYRMRISSDVLRTPGDAAPGPVALEYDFYYYTEDDRNYLWEPSWTAGTFTFDEAESAMVVSMPKTWAPVWPGGHNAGGGDALVPVFAFCSTEVGLYGVYDWVEPPAGARYQFPGKGSGGVLQVGFDRPDGGRGGGGLAWSLPTGDGTSGHVTSVAPAGPTKVPLYLTNNAASRKLVELSASFIGDAPSGWNVSLTPTIMLPAGEVRTVHLIVTPPASAELGASVPIAIDVQAAGEPLGASATTNLKVTPVLSAEHNTFYVHSRYYGGAGHPLDPVQDAMFVPYRLYANLLETDPAYEDQNVPMSILNGVFGSEYLSPLVRPVRLDPADPVMIDLAFTGDPSATVRVELTLMADDEPLFSIMEYVPGDGTTTVEALLTSEEVIELEAGTELYYWMYVTKPGLGPQTVGETALVPVQTRFSLPVMTSTDSLVVTDGRFLPSIALARGEESTTYVNPGSEYAFDLVLSNEGIEPDDLRLSVNATNATGWEVALKPGNAFRVQPGNSTPFALSVVPPATAAEGDRAVLDVIARSRHDANVRAEIRLGAIVTTGVEVDAKPFAEREGQLAPLEEEEAEAPGLPVVGLLGALAAAVLVARRRR